MPRERIQSYPDGPVVSVGWSNDVGNVQIGIQRPAAASDGQDQELYSDVLDRSAINRVIRALRKARDKGLGADA